MKKLSTIAFILLALALLIVSLLPIRSKILTDLLLFPIEKKFQTDIEFSSSSIWLPAHVLIDEVSVIEESGRLYHVNSIGVYYNLVDLLFKREIFFVLEGVKLYQNIGLLDSIANMLVISRMPDIEFDKIEGVVQLKNSGTIIKRIYAYNDTLRIKGRGWADREGSLDCDINFSFSRDMISKIPDPVKAALLKDEGGGWMGIAFKAKGNYKKPSLRITGDMLKMNIKELF